MYELKSPTGLLANEIRDEEFLESRGYKKVTCSACDGKGGKDEKGAGLYLCSKCRGYGFEWKKQNGT